MTVRQFLVLPLLLILLSSTIMPFSFASVATESQEDIYAGCRDEQSLVYRFTYQDYICLDPPTAERWVKLGLAEIIQNATVTNQKNEQTDDSDTVYYGAPPPAPKSKSVSDDDSECRVGFALVYRFSYGDLYCINSATAKTWERLGLVTIIDNMQESEKLSADNIDKLLHERDTIKEDPDTQNQVTDNLIPKAIDSKNISLPPYPTQQPIHPDLESVNDLRSPPEIYQINERIWAAVGYDTSNSIMIEGDKGLIIVDTLSNYETAKKVLHEFRKITDKPIKTIIYTNGNIDHVQGTKAFLEEGDGNVEIIAHENLLNSYINENIILGPITSLRSDYALGKLLPDDGIDSTNSGGFSTPSPTVAFVPPTHIFSSKFLIDISGVNIELVSMPGGSSDQIYVWLADDDTLLIGDSGYDIFPNNYSIQGSKFQDPMNYVNALDQMILLDAKYLIPGHTKPISGQDNVLDILTLTRDLIQYIHDQTIRGMNNGYTADELAHKIRLPPWFENNSWLIETRGEIPWYIKQIYFGNLGWYQGDPTFLSTLSDTERAFKIVDGFGGIDKVLDQIRTAIANKEYDWASELATYVIHVDSSNDEAKLLKAYALRVMGKGMPSIDGRNWALTTALDLEGKIHVDSSMYMHPSIEQLMDLPIETILKTLPTKINSVKLDDKSVTMSIHYSDLDTWYTLQFRNGILVVLDGADDSSSYSITLDSKTHKSILAGNLSIVDGIDSENVIQGDLEEIQEIFGYVDPIMSVDEVFQVSTLS